MKSPTYTVLFKAIVLIDMVAETSLWIAGNFALEINLCKIDEI